MANSDVLREELSTGVIYNDEVIKHYCTWDPNYSENPARYSEIIKRCNELNLLDRCKRLPSQSATQEELSLIHTSDIISQLQECENKCEEELEEISSCYDSVYINQDTYKAALLSAGSTKRLVEAVCKNEIKNGMAIVRPPGHHAMQSEYCGYCYFNNVALAANCALNEWGLKKILIVDWDIHHGQATQQMFYKDPRVLYFSIHRYENGSFWPNLEESNCDFVGEGDGKGYNFNVPLNKTGLGNADYLAIFQELLLPVAMEFQPELIIVSAGYDAAIGCPEGCMLVTPACYAHFITALSVFASGRLAVVLEGGYFLQSLAEGAALTLRALLGDPCPQIQPLERADESTLETIRNVIYTHRPYWKCFQFYGTYMPSDQPLKPDQFVPNFPFVGTVPRPEKFQTRNCYPLQSEEIISAKTNLLNNLMKITNLHVPEFHYHLIVSRTSEAFKLVRPIFENLNGITNELVNDGKIIQNFSNIALYRKKLVLDLNIMESRIQMVDKTHNSFVSLAIGQLVNGITRSVIIDKAVFVHKNDQSSQPSLINQLMTHLIENRTVFLNLYTERDASSLTKRKNFLHFSLTSHQSEKEIKSNETSEGSLEDNHIEIQLDKDPKDHHYITTWLKIILPICYQFDPEIVVINIANQKYFQSSLQGHFLRWLTSLAGGKVILLTDFSDQENEQLLSQCKALLGYHLPTPKIIAWASDETECTSLKNTIEKLARGWSNVKLCAKFPADNRD